MNKQKLLDALYDPENSEGQIKAVYKMRYIDDQEIKSILFRVCYDADNPKLRRTAVQTLQILSPQKALNAFIKSTYNSDVIKRRHAYYHLGDLGDRKGLATVLKGLNDPDAEVRKAAVISTGKLGEDGYVVKRLQKLLNQFEPEFIRKSVNYSIEQIQKRMKDTKPFNKKHDKTFNKSLKNSQNSKKITVSNNKQKYTPKAF